MPPHDVLGLSLDDAIQRGLKNNLGVILSGTQTRSARAQRLSQLQSLLPDVEFTAKEAELQIDLAAQGLRIPGFPTIIGPFGYIDLRASLTWSLVDVKALRTLHGGKARLCGGAIVGAGCARHGGVDGGQRVPAGPGRSELG